MYTHIYTGGLLFLPAKIPSPAANSAASRRNPPRGARLSCLFIRGPQKSLEHHSNMVPRLVPHYAESSYPLGRPLTKRPVKKMHIKSIQRVWASQKNETLISECPILSRVYFAIMRCIETGAADSGICMPSRTNVTLQVYCIMIRGSSVYIYTRETPAFGGTSLALRRSDGHLAPPSAAVKEKINLRRMWRPIV